MKLNSQKMKNLIMSVALGLLVQTSANALPESPQVVHGSATVTVNGQSMSIQQASQQAIINWNGFSIQSGELVRFLQPSQVAAILNRVQGVDPSVINGILEGNGTVMLINPNGVLIGPGGAVNTGSFLASTLDVSDADFLSGRLAFEQDTSVDLASIVNQGKIQVADGGFVVLTSPSVSNEGLILARAGSVNIGAGTQATVNFDGRKLVHFSVDLQGDGALLLSKQQTNDVLAQVVNNGGVQEAGSLSSSGTIQASRVNFQSTGNLNLPGETRSQDIVAQAEGDANLGSHFALDGHSIDIDAGGDITFDALVAEGVNGVGGVVDLSAGGSILANEGGLGIAGDIVNLRADRGNISTPVSADAISAEAPLGSVDLTVTPGLIDGETLVGERGTNLAVDAGGNVNVDSVNTLYIDRVSGSQIRLNSATGSIADAGDSPEGDNLDIIAGQSVFLSAADFIGTVDQPLEVNIQGDLTVLAGREISGTSGVLNGFVGGEFFQDSATAGVVYLNYDGSDASIQRAQLGLLDNANTIEDESELGGATVPALFFVYLTGSTDEDEWLDLLRGAVVWEDEEDEADEL